MNAERRPDERRLGRTPSRTNAGKTNASQMNTVWTNAVLYIANTPWDMPLVGEHTGTIMHNGAKKDK